MASLEDIRNLAEEVITTYANRLETVSRVIEDAYELLNRGRAEREDMGARLRDLLAEGNSLRRKDFDQMISDIFAQQNEREEAIRAYLKTFLQEQRVLAERLKEVLRTEDLEFVRSIRAAMERGLKEAKQVLTDFHHEEQTLMRRFKALLNRGHGLTVAEFKTAVREIKSDLGIWTESALSSHGVL